MVEPTREELAVLERQRRAFLGGDRETWVSTWDPAAVFESLPDWPGVLEIEGPEAAWDQYVEFLQQFKPAAYENLNIERHGRFTIFDVRLELVGRASGAPMELLWTLVLEFDPASQRHRSARWFHTRDEAVAQVDRETQQA